MRKFDRYVEAAKVVALCLPPVIVSLAGLAALSRKPSPSQWPSQGPRHSPGLRHGPADTRSRDAGSPAGATATTGRGRPSHS